MSNAIEPCWRVSVDGELPLRYWEGDYVVYNPLSGSTHVLDVVAGELLKSIAADRGRLTQLHQRIADFLEVPNDASVAESVREILAQLDELGLIEQIDAC